MNLLKVLVQDHISPFFKLKFSGSTKEPSHSLIPTSLQMMTEKWSRILTLLGLIHSALTFSFLGTTITALCLLVRLLCRKANNSHVPTKIYFFSSISLSFLYIIVPTLGTNQMLFTCLLSQIISTLNTIPQERRHFLELIPAIPLIFSIIWIREGSLYITDLLPASQTSMLQKIVFLFIIVIIMVILMNIVRKFIEDHNELASTIKSMIEEREELKLKRDEAAKILQAHSTKIVSLEQELHESIARRDSIASSLSHDMRNPLNVILGNLDLLIMEVKEPKSLEMLESSRDSCEMLLSLVNNVLDAGKIHSGQLEINPQSVAIFPMIQNLWSTTSVYITKKGLTGHVAVDRKMPRMLEFDKHRVVQICFNVISNAVKFTAKGIVNLHFSWIPATPQLDEDLKQKLTEPSSATMRLVKRNISEEDDSDVRTKSSWDKQLSPSVEINDEAQPEQVQLTLDGKSPSVGRRRPLSYKSMSMIIENSKKTFSMPFSVKKLTGSFIQDPLIEDDLSLELIGPEGFLKIECLDSGCGISEQLQSRLFKEFERGDGSITRRFGGSGLGLYITNELVKLMGGWITVDTEVGTGTKICIVLPAKKVGSSTAELPSLTLKKIPSTISNMFNVLIVDDSAYNINILVKFFNKLGLKSIYTAENGREAVELFEAKGSGFFAMITMDLQMPEMDGFTACREIRKIEKKRFDPPTPIVIISGNCSKEEQDQCLSEEGEIRAASFYRKPITFMDVEALVRKTILQPNPMPLRLQASMKHEQKKNTLMVSGDDFTIDLLSTLLMKYDCELETAEDLQTALRAVKANQCLEYIAIDCDKYQLKHVEIMEVLEQFRKESRQQCDKENSGISLIALVTDELGIERGKLKRMGFDKVLVKPIRLTNLREVFCLEAIDFTSPLNI